MTSGPVVRKPLLVGGVACYAVVFALFSVAERPGLGIGHGYYVAIALVALASNALGGAAAGLLATLLYAAGTYVTPRVPVANIATVATVIRLVTYVTVGTVIGHYAARSRTLIVRAEELMDELRLLAARDVVTGLPNQRSFEQAVNSRIAAGAPFALVLCDLPGEPVPVPLVDRVLAFSEQLTRAVDPEADVARVGDDQFAVLAAVDDVRGTRVLAGRIEDALLRAEKPTTAGWSSFPRDAEDALGLFTVASERLYARRITYGGLQDAVGYASG
jgi:GGDEF domain-containing protein